MDLQCLQENLKGQKILVNGNSYAIGEDCIARNVSEADAAKLLKFPSWRKPVVRSPVKEKEPKGDVTIPSLEPAVIAAEMRKQIVTPYPPSPPPVEVPAVAEVQEVGEWPDPKESMDLDYLHKMADAYEVKYDSKITKKALVKAIHKAMYE